MQAEAVVSGHYAQLGERLAAMLPYAVKLTLSPAQMTEKDLDPLRTVGLSDRDIVDLNQVASYFNYVNRIAHGLGVELEGRWREPTT